MNRAFYIFVIMWVIICGTGCAVCLAQTSPWWQRPPLIWGQPNCRESDPPETDVDGWIDFLMETRSEIALFNAGGMIAYYPTNIPGHYKSRWLGDRDLFGEFAGKAKAAGMQVFARLDPSKVMPPFLDHHPEWIMRKQGGEFVGGKPFYSTCLQSDYYWEYVPSILRELFTRYDLDGVFANAFASPHTTVCYCENCKDVFRREVGGELPGNQKWSNPRYRRWLKWRNDRYFQIWDRWNTLLKELNHDAVWVGHFLPFGDFREDLEELGKRVEVIEVDMQGRGDNWELWQIGLQGRLMRGIFRPEAALFNTTGSWYRGTAHYRQLAKPAPELRIWTLDGLASGLGYKWHYIGTHQEDRRQFKAPVPLAQWIDENREYYGERTSLANIALVFSQNSYWQDNPLKPGQRRSYTSFLGMGRALVAAGLHFDVILDKRITPELLKQYDLLVLPDVNEMSEQTAGRIRSYVRDGGGIVATFQTSLFDDQGRQRDEYALSDVFGADYLGEVQPFFAERQMNSLQRIEQRHPLVKGFEETAFIASGGMAAMAQLHEGVQPILYQVPTYRTLPPELSFPSEPRTDYATLIANSFGRGRVAFFPGNIGDAFHQSNHPDLARLLANAFDWTMTTSPTVQISGQGFVDVYCYDQPEKKRVLVNLINVGHYGARPGLLSHTITLQDQVVTLNLPGYTLTGEVQSIIGNGRLKLDGNRIKVPVLTEHEILVLPYR